MTLEEEAYFALLVEKLGGDRDAAAWFAEVTYMVVAHVLDAVGERLDAKGHPEAGEFVKDLALKARGAEVPA